MLGVRFSEVQSSLYFSVACINLNFSCSAFNDLGSRTAVPAIALSNDSYHRDKLPT